LTYAFNRNDKTNPRGNNVVVGHKKVSFSLILIYLVIFHVP